jgi:hypothetical protein
MGVDKTEALLVGAQKLGAVLADPESRQMLVDFAQEYYGTSSQITQSELLGKLPMELLIAAGTAGAGQAANAAGIPQRLGSAIGSLAKALDEVKVRSPIVPVGRGEMGMLGIKNLQNPLVRTPDPRTGVGYGPSDPPVRIQGDWSENDLKQGLLGHPPRGLGSPDLHHADQMPGSGVHEVLPDDHRNNPALHRNPFNQGVTDDMREADRQLHWWYRAREQGADELLPDWIYD